MFSEISLNILDVVQNSISARASLIEITVNIDTKGDTLTVVIEDDGSGMSAEELSKVVDPFYTTGKREIQGWVYLFSKLHLK